MLNSDIKLERSMMDTWHYSYNLNKKESQLRGIDDYSSR